MQTDRIQIAVRSRSGWEAVDLGFRMARAWWRPLYGSWLALVAPLLAGLIYVLWSQPLWLLVALWWLKPLFERLPVHVLSEALFGAPPRLRDVVRSAPRWLRGGTLLSLTWLRPSPARSMILPVLQLEGLRGQRRALRTRLLVGPDGPRACWLLIACSIFQVFPVLCGLLGFGLAFLPDEVGLSDALALWLTDAVLDDALRAGAIAYAVSLSCVEPLYVAGGFALYINRRIFLEGWDIELIFRKLARRAGPARPGRAPALRASAVLLLCAALAAPVSSQAQEDPLPAPAAGERAAGSDVDPCPMRRPEDAADCIEAVLADPVFGSREMRTRWVPRSWDPDFELDPESPPQAAVSDVVSRLLRALMLALVLIGVAVLWRYARRLRPAGAGASATSDRDDPDPEPRIGVLDEPEPLPDDFVDAARRRFAAADPAGALSLLYRGAIACLARRGLELPASATEAECARHVSAIAPGPLADDFDALVRTWQLCAYGSRMPQPQRFDQLCARWQQHASGGAA